MYLGRIITKNKKNIDTIKFVDITNDKSLALKSEIPTLIIGKNNAEEILGKENLHYLDRKISDNLYWTFGKTERRTEYEHDLKSFNQMIVNRLNKNVKYHYISLFTMSFTEIKTLINLLDSIKRKIIYIADNLIYIYCENNVIGISLGELLYIGIKRNKIITFLLSKPNTQILDNTYKIPMSTKKLINNSKILVPYVFFLENA